MNTTAAINNSYQSTAAYSDNAMMDGIEQPTSSKVSVIGDDVQSASKGRWIKPAGLALALFAVVAFLTKSSNTAQVLPTTATSAQMVTLGSSKGGSVTPCTFKECFESNCNWEVAPYTCLIMNGGPHGGCSPTPWYVPQTCTTQCDLSACGEQEVPEDQPSCDEACDPTYCKNTGERLCGSAAPYQCKVGSSAFGCSDDEFLWAFKSSDSTCSSCCNAAKCA